MIELVVADDEVVVLGDDQAEGARASACNLEEEVGMTGEYEDCMTQVDPAFAWGERVAHRAASYHTDASCGVGDRTCQVEGAWAVDLRVGRAGKSRW